MTAVETARQRANDEERVQTASKAYNAMSPTEKTAYSEEVRKNYKLFRDYEEHENQLVNQRMTWLITAQSVLFGTFGFSMQKYFELLSKTDTPPLFAVGLHSSFGALLLIFCLIGMSSAKAGNEGVRGARDSQFGIRRTWWDRYRADAVVLGYPVIYAGGIQEALDGSLSITDKLPKVFYWVWWLILLATVTISGGFAYHLDFHRKLFSWLGGGQ